MPHKKDDGERHTPHSRERDISSDGARRVSTGQYSGRVGLHNKRVGNWWSINALITVCYWVHLLPAFLTPSQKS